MFQLARSAEIITVGSSTVNYQGIYSGSGGTITVIHADDSSSVTYAGVPSGIILPIHVKQVSAGPADMVGFFIEYT